MLFFHHTILLLENSSLNNLRKVHSPSNSSLLIIAREEYEALSNVTSAFTLQKSAKFDNLELRKVLKYLIIRKKSWIEYRG